MNKDSEISNYSSEEDDLSSHNRKRKPDIGWVAKALKPALQLYKWARPTGNGMENEPAATDRSLTDTFASIRRSKLGIQDCSLSHLTIVRDSTIVHMISIRDEPTSEGYSTHFGTIEPARWFLTHEIDRIRRCLKDHKVASWISPFKNEDRKGVIDLVASAMHVVSSIQDVAQKLSEYAKFREQT
ncbi:UNVERIFIED_CONTAM: hypothetical protein Scaly_0647000 [Sesamum calycinum]|uniref:Uncharacterized protein n=1 Tax=Sesamum calycinum TaxID=2727403 RepID=A0AAW2RTS2_9LAMI